jgi:hypothetical protein
MTYLRIILLMGWLFDKNKQCKPLYIYIDTHKPTRKYTYHFFLRKTKEIKISILKTHPHKKIKQPHKNYPHMTIKHLYTWSSHPSKPIIRYWFHLITFQNRYVVALQRNNTYINPLNIYNIHIKTNKIMLPVIQSK